jgi:hypothetical protein
MRLRVSSSSLHAERYARRLRSMPLSQNATTTPWPSPRLAARGCRRRRSATQSRPPAGARRGLRRSDFGKRPRAYSASDAACDGWTLCGYRVSSAPPTRPRGLRASTGSRAPSTRDAAAGSLDITVRPLAFGTYQGGLPTARSGRYGRVASTASGSAHANAQPSPARSAPRPGRLKRGLPSSPASATTGACRRFLSRRLYASSGIAPQTSGS